MAEPYQPTPEQMEEVLTEGLMHAALGRILIEKGLKACVAAEEKLAAADAQWETYRYLRDHLIGHRKVIEVLLEQLLVEDVDNRVDAALMLELEASELQKGAELVEDVEKKAAGLPTKHL